MTVMLDLLASNKLINHLKTAWDGRDAIIISVASVPIIY